MGLNEGLEQARFDALVDEVGDAHHPARRPSEPAGRTTSDARSRRCRPATRRRWPSRRIGPGTGTNGLVLRPPGVIRFRFGTGSFAAHVDEVARAGVPLVAVNRAGLAFDLDTPEDLVRWLKLGDAA